MIERGKASPSIHRSPLFPPPPKCCSLLGEVKQLHGLVSKFGVVAGSALVDVDAKCGDVSSCRKIFDSMEEEEKDNFVWSSMISVLHFAGVDEQRTAAASMACVNSLLPLSLSLSRLPSTPESAEQHMATAGRARWRWRTMGVGGGCGLLAASSDLLPSNVAWFYGFIGGCA